MRDLSDTLIDLAEAFTAAERTGLALRVSELTLDMPLEVRLLRCSGGWTFSADAPNWRWRTPFDRRPGRLRVRWQEEPSP